MAMKAMKELITESMTGFAKQSQVWAEKNWETGELVTNEKSEYKYRLPVLIPDGNVTQELEVVCWAKDNPFAEIPAMSGVIFKNVYIQFGVYNDKNGTPRKFWNLIADSVKKA